MCLYASETYDQHLPPYTQISNIDSSVDDPDEVVFEWQDVLKDVLLKVSLDKISILFPLF